MITMNYIQYNAVTLGELQGLFARNEIANFRIKTFGTGY